MSDVKRKQNIIHSKEQKIKDLFVIDTKCAKKNFFFQKLSAKLSSDFN